MTIHEGPHFEVPPDDQRCEALIPGRPAYNWEWMKHDHRCPRRANQVRGLPGSVDVIVVCWQHAKSKRIIPWKEKTVSQDDIPSPREFDQPFKRKVGTVDATPRWQDLLPDLLAAVDDPKRPAVRIAAREELARMAKAADGYVALQKRLQTATEDTARALRELQAKLIDGGPHRGNR